MDISYSLKRSTRAHTMRLAVYPDSRVVVTAPHLFGLAAIERFVRKHSEWITRHVERTKEKRVIRVARKDIPKLKGRALAVASARCAHFGGMYGVTYKKISIRAQKTRWGSCSRAGNLSFNYKLAVLPPHIADYVIVHEICHLAHMNHGRKFWDLVARTTPRYRAIRKELRNIVVSFS